MSSRPDYANPGTWNSETVTEIGDVFMVSDGDAQHTSIYRAGDFYIAQFAEAIGSKYFPAPGVPDGNWTFAQLGCTDIKIDINGGPSGKVYANGRNQNKITVHYRLTGPDGNPLPDAVQKRAKVTLVRAVSGEDLSAEGWRVSDAAGPFAIAPGGSRESDAATVGSDHTATQVLYLSHDDNGKQFAANIAARVTYGSSVFDDVNGDYSGDLITVTPLPAVYYQLGAGTCEKGQTYNQDGGQGVGYQSSYSQVWVVPADHTRPFVEVEVRRSPGAPPASMPQSNLRNCMFFRHVNPAPRVWVYTAFFWPLTASGGLETTDLALGPYVRVTPRRGAVNAATVLQIANWGTSSWPAEYSPKMTVCRASDAWGNCGYFILKTNTVTDGANAYEADILDAAEGDFSGLPAA